MGENLPPSVWLAASGISYRHPAVNRAGRGASYLKQRRNDQPMKRLFAVLALAACAFAQSRGGRASKAAPSAAPAVQDKWPIQTIAVEGNQVFPPAAILAVAGLKIGQVAVKPEFEDARDRLTAS